MSRQAHPIRSVTQRLSSVQPGQLPFVIPSILEALLLCGDALSGQENAVKDASDLAVQVHKLKTQISSLLQSKNQASHWAAVVLIKTYIEIGGQKALSGSLSWVRGLLGLLGRPEPLATKEIAILALTRIFLLTHGQPTLLREITTPSLAPFVTSCLNLMTLKNRDNESKATDVHSPLLNTMLLSLSKLVPNHPASMRPFAIRLRSILAPLLAPTPSTIFMSQEKAEAVYLPSAFTVGLGQRLHALLPNCAAKGGSSEEWSKYVVLVLQNINRIEGLVFRGVVRHQVGLSGRANTTGDTVRDDIVDDLQLPAWQGIHAGCERLIGLLQLLQAYLATTTASTINMPLGVIFTVVEQILSVYAPEYSQSRGAEMQLSPAVSREEREALYSMLPSIHTAAIECLSLLVTRTSHAAASFASEALDQISWLFQRTRTNDKSRIAMYDLLSQVIEIIGPSANAENVSSATPIIRKASRDLVSQSEDTKQPVIYQDSQASKTTKTNPDTYLDNSKKKPVSSPKPSEELRAAAIRLLTISVITLPAQKVKVSLRHEIDRVAVLLQDEKLMQASILNPARSQGGAPMPTLLPFLSRAHPAALGTEALLRPRMPPIKSNAQMADELSEDEMETDLPPDRLDEPDATDQTSASNDLVAPMASDSSMQNAPMMSVITDPLLPLESPKRPLETKTSLNQPSLSSTIDEPIQKRPRLELRLSEELVTSTDGIIQNQVPPEAMVTATDNLPPFPSVDKPEKVDAEAEGSDSDSEGSFQIPPIIMDSDLSDDDSDEGDEDVKMATSS